MNFFEAIRFLFDIIGGIKTCVELVEKLGKHTDNSGNENENNRRPSKH